ncbi:hypothetical protein [Vreelandella venusta]|uniref:DUF1281 family ferredoxin-like fold protein n=1 Tax=Vreelandella venusta TaxID=44935 RepID=UPI0018DA3678|nr:hypothetical protein [Halomonas venusta]QPI62393.1 hypothetical protein IR195_10825 [Halomonas venusta]
MPNWVTNVVKAPKHVIEAMTNEKGNVDFSLAIPFPGPNNDWSGIASDAEQAAEIICGIPTSEHPLLRDLQAASRQRFDIKTLSDESFQQFIGMVENYRACGYLHGMEFARKVWGTKWNACESDVKADEGIARFDTAWSCPEGVLESVSKRFPDDVIEVTFADEDIGSNCGTFKLKDGEVLEPNIAPSWQKMDEEERAKWSTFALDVKGWDAEEEEG